MSNAGRDISVTYLNIINYINRKGCQLKDIQVYVGQSGYIYMCVCFQKYVYEVC